MNGALITSDWHGHNWSRFATTLANGVNSRFADLLATIDQMEAYIEEYEPRYLIHLGDLTHRRYFVQFSIFAPLVERLVRIVQRYDVTIILLVGNHDRENETHHALGSLKFIPGLRVVERPQFVDLDDFGPVFMCPYMDGESVAEAFRASAGASIAKLAFTHYAFDGKAMGAGEYAVPSALRKSDAEHFERVYLGHVHAPEIEDGGRIVYVGAPLHFDFGDSGDRYCWYLPATRVLAPLRLTGPRFVTTTYPRVGVPPETSGFLRVLNTPANLFDDVKRAALDAGWFDCVPIEERMPHEAVRVLSSAVMADEQAIRAWVGRAYAELTDDERSRIVEYGLDCLREAQR